MTPALAAYPPVMAWITPGAALLFWLLSTVYYVLPWLSVRFVFMRERAAAVFFALGWALFSLLWEPWAARAEAERLIAAGEDEIWEDWTMTFTTYWKFASWLIGVCTILAFRPEFGGERTGKHEASASDADR